MWGQKVQLFEEGIARFGFEEGIARFGFEEGTARFGFEEGIVGREIDVKLLSNHNPIRGSLLLPAPP